MLVVDADQLFGHLAYIKFLLVAGSERVYKRLALVVVGHGSEKLFPGLFDGVCSRRPAPCPAPPRAPSVNGCLFPLFASMEFDGAAEELLCGNACTGFCDAP